LCVLCLGRVLGAAETKPNVLLIVVDDLRDHEIFAGANVVGMPNLDRLAGLTPPDGLEGTSSAPLVYDPNSEWDAVAFTQSNRGSGCSVCDGRYRYTHWGDGGVELYDHDSDPGEWYNQTNNADYAAVKSKLHDKLFPPDPFGRPRR